VALAVFLDRLLPYHPPLKKHENATVEGLNGVLQLLEKKKYVNLNDIHKHSLEICLQFTSRPPETRPLKVPRYHILLRGNFSPIIVKVRLRNTSATSNEMADFSK